MPDRTDPDESRPDAQAPEANRERTPPAAEIVAAGVPSLPTSQTEPPRIEQKKELSPAQRQALEDRVGHIARGEVGVLVATWVARRPKSARAYEGALRQFATWLAEEQGVVFTSAEAVEVLFACTEPQANALAEQWAAHLGEHLAAGTVRSRLSAVRSIVRFAKKLGRVSWELTLDLPRVADYRDMRGPDPQALEALIDIIRNDESKRGRRDWCLLSLLLLQALRRFEIVGLDVGHFEPGHGRIWVLGKGRSEREEVQLVEVAQEGLEAWLRVHDSPDGDSPLFHCINTPANEECRLTVDGIYAIFQKHYRGLVAERLGIPESDVRLRPHGFRHAAITALVESGTGYEEVRKFARHASLATTQRYIDNVSSSVRESGRAIARTFGMLS